MVKVSISFRGDLQDLLSPDKRNKILEVSFRGRRSIKDLIESFRIPHTEVDRVRVNTGLVDFSYILQDGDRVEVYSVLENHPYQGGKPLLAKPMAEPAFLCDVHLWKLTRRLRLMGFDVGFNDTWGDDQLADISRKEGKILLTRDRGLLMRKEVTRGLLIRSTSTEKQVEEVLERLNLRDKCRPFSRCLLCNGFLQKVEEGDEAIEKIKQRIPPRVLSWCRQYHICLSCDHIYWQGSHYKKLLAMVKGYLA